MPASVAQQRIWSSHEEHGSAWNVAVRFQLRGRLDTGLFEGAVRSLIARHEILRTSFAMEDGTLEQVIQPSSQVVVNLFDLVHLGATEQERELDRLSKQEAREPFDLSRLPLFRISLVRLDREEHVLLLTFHHAVCDGWSVGLISGELMKIYGELVAETGNEPSETLQYADYAVWQAERRSSEEYVGHQAFWRRYLRDGQVENSLPNSKATAAPQDNEIVSNVLPPALTEAIRAIARQKGTTFFHVVLSAFAVARAAEKQSSSLTLGVPVSGRTSTELEGVVGTFVNYLPCRMSISPEQTIGDLIQKTAGEFTELIGHSEYRYEDMLALADDRPAYFDEVFICQRDFVRPVAAGGVELTAIPSVSPGALFGITFFLVERETGWRASCELDPSRHSVADAGRLLSRFTAVLECFARNPDATVGSVFSQLQGDGISEMTAREDLRLEPGAEVLPTAIERSFVEFPASEAQMRYWLLDQSDAGDSTFHLRIRLLLEGKLDVECLVRAFHHLVRRHETLRTTFAMDDEGLRQRVHEPSLPSFEHQSRPAASQPSADVKRLLAREDNWAFNLETGPLLRVLLIDVAEQEWILAITMAHLVGDGWSCGVLLRDFEAAYGAYLAGREPDLGEIGIQYGDFAVHEQAWLQGQEAENRAGFWRTQLTGKLPTLDLPSDVASAQTTKRHGEVASFELDPSIAASVRILARRLETTPFVIYGAIFQALLYRYSGQTDIVFSTPLASRTEESAHAIGPFSVPILLRSQVQAGWSARQFIEALRDLAMDTFENALPFDRYAELVALDIRRGRHALNQVCFFYQKAFVDSSETAGLRIKPLPMMVTGAGFEWQLAVIERADRVVAEFQYDAELYSSDSIEFALKHYQQLLTQCVEDSEIPVDSFSFATHLEVRLATEGASLLPISRRALGLEKAAQPVQEQVPAKPIDVLPETEQEIRMARLWEKVFRRNHLSIHADFFDLGGHSLTLARLQALIQKEYGVRIGAADIFVAPTIAALAARMSGDGQNASLHSRLIPIRATGTQTPLFLISQSMVFRRMAERLGADQPVFTIQMEDEDLEQIGSKATFEQIAAFYVDIIRQARPHGPYRIGGWCMSGWIAYEIAQQLRNLGETVELLLVVDAWAPGYWRDMIGRRRLFAKGSYYWSRFRLHSRTLSPMSNAERMRFFTERLRLWRAALARQLFSGLSVAGLSVDVKMEEQTTYVDQVVFAASRRYKAKPWDGRTLFFRSSEQPSGRFLADDMGWSELVRSNVSITTLPGDHRQIFDDPGAGILAEKISDLLSLGTDVSSDLKVTSRQTKSLVGYQGSNSCAIVTR